MIYIYKDNNHRLIPKQNRLFFKDRLAYARFRSIPSNICLVSQSGCSWVHVPCCYLRIPIEVTSSPQW